MLKGKKTTFFIWLPVIAVITFSLFGCGGEQYDFTFAFLTDIHLQPERNAEQGFQQAIQKVNQLQPDFVITGGDLVMDVLDQTYERADMLYTMYQKNAELFQMPVHNTIGNHEIYGIAMETGVDRDHPEYGKGMFEKRIGDRYSSFDFKGWHFMLLDSIIPTDDYSYAGWIDDEQMDWIEQDLTLVDPETPIVICTHIPLISAFPQLTGNPVGGTMSSLVVNNAAKVLELFQNHNLKLVLQGHLHFIEDIFAGGTRFITAGAVSASWWRGPRNGMEEGFAWVKVRDGSFDWEYIDFGWEAD